jgi:thiol-disulfide isomerase/thioredoxin
MTNKLAALSFFVISLINAQSLTDENFKDEISKGFIIVEFYAEWADSIEVSKVWKEISKAKDYQDLKIILCKSEQVKKSIKKYRLRTFPSLILFYNGSKKEVWKADFDGKLEITEGGINKSIDNVLAEDVF